MSAGSTTSITSNQLYQRVKRRKEEKIELEHLREENADLRGENGALRKGIKFLREKWNNRGDIINSRAMLILDELLNGDIKNGKVSILSLEADEILSNTGDAKTQLLKGSNHSKAIGDVFVKLENYAKETGFAIELKKTYGKLNTLVYTPKENTCHVPSGLEGIENKLRKVGKTKVKKVAAWFTNYQSPVGTDSRYDNNGNFIRRSDRQTG